MIHAYYLVNDRFERADAAALTGAAVWVDLLDPTPEEESAIEDLLGLDVPTREEMQEIEASSRLYREDEALFLTAPVLINSASAHPQNSAITFILTRACLVTVRYATPQAFTSFASRVTRQRGICLTSEQVLIGLMESVVDRLADVLERIGGNLDGLSHQVFRANIRQMGHSGVDLLGVMQSVGQNGDLNSKVRDSLLGFSRIIAFLGAELTGKDSRQRAKTVARDLRSLTEHAAFLSSKTSFLLDATLGLINIEQNNIIRLFSVIAAVFLPPTLIASIYGMNFGLMPELHWTYGYPMSLVLMVISAALPLFYFKRRGWL